MEETMGRGILLWLLGVPIPVIILLWLFFGHCAWHWKLDRASPSHGGARLFAGASFAKFRYVRPKSQAGGDAWRDS
jgi:hypothetical protein